MASTTHSDGQGLSRGNAAGSTRAPTELEDEKQPTDDAAKEDGDDKSTSSPAANEEDDEIVYPEGITFILIITSLLLSTFLMALDQV
jgi:cell division septation protein DedD